MRTAATDDSASSRTIRIVHRHDRGRRTGHATSRCAAARMTGVYDTDDRLGHYAGDSETAITVTLHGRPHGSMCSTEARRDDLRRRALVRRTRRAVRPVDRLRRHDRRRLGLGLAVPRVARQDRRCSVGQRDNQMQASAVVRHRLPHHQRRSSQADRRRSRDRFSVTVNCTARRSAASATRLPQDRHDRVSDAGLGDVSDIPLPSELHGDRADRSDSRRRLHVGARRSSPAAR